MITSTVQNMGECDSSPLALNETVIPAKAGIHRDRSSALPTGNDLSDCVSVPLRISLTKYGVRVAKAGLLFVPRSFPVMVLMASYLSYRTITVLRS